MNLLLAMLAIGCFHVLLLFAHGSYIAFAHGAGWGLGRRSDSIERTDLDRRFERSIANNMESLVAFVPIVVANILLGAEGAQVDFAALIYVVARMGFVMIYLANVPYIRTVFWFLGQGSLVVLAVTGFVAAANAI